MRYTINHTLNEVEVNVEATFTLIDYTALIVCFILGFIFAVFFWLFFAVIFIKLFSSKQFIFNTDKYIAMQYVRWFSYFRLKRREFSFSEVKKIVFSNQESGNALQDSFTFKEWFTIDIVLKTNYSQMVKVPEDELESADELYFVLKENLGDFFIFTDIVHVEES